MVSPGMFPHRRVILAVLGILAFGISVGSFWWVISSSLPGTWWHGGFRDDLYFYYYCNSDEYGNYLPGQSNCCGNGIKEKQTHQQYGQLPAPSGQEECDDGNSNSYDGCDDCATATINRCGDGTRVCAGTDGIAGNGDDEQCDDGNTASGDGCNSTCKLERCGDGILQPTAFAGSVYGGLTCGVNSRYTGYAEECDDGNSTLGDGCGFSCRSEGCGNGRLDPGEDFDYGPESVATNCKFCGDGFCGFYEMNPSDPKYCPQDCQPSSSSSSSQGPQCGDGTRDADGADGEPDTADDEECDDGNTQDDDGCDSTCKEEGGTCDDDEDGDEDGLTDAASVFSCTDLNDAGSLDSVTFKKKRDEEPYPNPWPATDAVNAIKNAAAGKVTVYAPASLDAVPEGLRDGFSACYFGPDIPEKTSVQVEDAGAQAAYTCDRYDPAIPAAAVTQFVDDSRRNYDELYNTLLDDAVAQRGFFARLWASLFAATTTVTPGPGADPYNVRVAIGQDCYTKCRAQEEGKSGSPRTDRIRLEECLVGCVCGASGNYSVFSLQVQKEKIDANIAKVKADGDKEKAKIATDPKYKNAQQRKEASDAVDAKVKEKVEALDNQRPDLRATTRKMYEQLKQKTEKELALAEGARKGQLQNIKATIDMRLAEINGMSDEDYKKTENQTKLRTWAAAVFESQNDCHDDCMAGKRFNFNCGGSELSDTKAQCCRAKCVEDMCPFVRPPYTPQRLQLSSAAASSAGGGGTPGGQGGGSSQQGGTDGGTSGGDDGGDTGGADTGGAGPGGTTGGGASSQASFASRVSSALSVSACYTEYTVPPEHIPSDADLVEGDNILALQDLYQRYVLYPPPGAPLDRFIVPLPKLAYGRPGVTGSRSLWGWTRVRFNGSFVDPLKVDLPDAFGGAPTLYDGKNTFWGFRTEECNPSGTGTPQACNFIVNKYTVSTQGTQTITIPNSVILASLPTATTGFMDRTLLAQDGSLWLSVVGVDVLYQVKPDLSVRAYPFSSVGCRETGRPGNPLTQWDDNYCRGAFALTQTKDGTVWFGLQANTASGRKGQIGKITAGGAGTLYVVTDITFPVHMFPGYDDDVWFTYSGYSAALQGEAGVGDPARHVGRMQSDGTVTYVQLPGGVLPFAMAAGKDGMWYTAQTGDQSAGITQLPPSMVLGFIGKTTSFARRYPLGFTGLRVDADGVPWSNGWRLVTSSSAASATVVKFSCNSTSSSSLARSSSTSVRSSSSSTRSSAPSVSSVSSRLSSRISSMASSALTCPGDPCGAGGTAYCRSLELACNPLASLPCFECVIPGRSSIPLSSVTFSTSSAPTSIPSSTRASSKATVVFSAVSSSKAPTSFGGDDIATLRSSRPSTQFEGGHLDVLLPSASSATRPPVDVLAARVVCGDGALGTGEECDDRNTRDFDGCSADCLLERGRCGDGIVQTLLDEQCEPSTHDASLPYGCGADCRFVSSLCGNGTVDDGEQCDGARQNSNAQNAFCRLDCSFARCGDGIIDSRQAEQCDDGNRIGSDGCSARCTLERAAPSPLAAQVFNLPKTPITQQPVQQGYTAQTWQVQPFATLPTTANSGPGALAVMAAGAAAGVGYMRRKGKK